MDSLSAIMLTSAALLVDLLYDDLDIVRFMKHTRFLPDNELITWTGQVGVGECDT